MADIKFSQLPVAIALTGTEYVPIVQGGLDKRTQLDNIAGLINLDVPANAQFFVIGNGGPVVNGTYGYLEIPFSGLITGANALNSSVCSVTIDVWKCTFNQFDGGATHPVVADSITNGFPLVISSSTKGVGATSNWSPIVNTQDILAFNLSGVTSVTNLTISIFIQRNI